MQCAGGDVTSPKGAMRRTGLPVVNPVPAVLRRLRFMGLQQIPDLVDEVVLPDATVMAQPPAGMSGNSRSQLFPKTL